MNETKRKFIESFETIASIPHPPEYTDKLKQFLSEYATSLGYSVEDDLNNLIITIPATCECEKAPPVIIQCHLDMVASKKAGNDHDFYTDGLSLEISDDQKFLSANETSLGADDGFAICYFMMLMQETELAHPTLYLVCTNDEEIGCLGARKLDFSKLSDSEFMINLDCELEGLIPSASAFGQNLLIKRKPITQEERGHLWELRLSFADSAHPVAAIEQSTLQPAKLLSQILIHLVYTTDTYLVSIHSENSAGTLANFSSAVVLSKTDQDEFIKQFRLIKNLLNQAYHGLDIRPYIRTPFYIGVDQRYVFTSKDSINFLRDEMFMPTGVLIREDNTPIASIAQVRNNVNTFACKDILQLRAKTEDLIILLRNILIDYFSKTKNEIVSLNTIPGWKLKEDSLLLQRVKQLWHSKFGKEIDEKYIHGFLENGVFKNALPDLDIISFGPTVSNIHSYNEKIDLDSAVRVYEFLKDLLSDFCPKQTDVSTIIERTNGETESIQSFYQKRNQETSEIEIDCSADCPFKTD